MWIAINVSRNFVPKGQINDSPTLVQIMALTGRQASIWTNDSGFTDAYMHNPASMS